MTRAREFPGAFALTGLSNFFGKVDAIERSAGRLDFALSPLLFERLVDPQDLARIESELKRVASAVAYSGPLHISHHLMVVLPGAVDQAWHADNDSAVFFQTILLPLTEPVQNCGRTEFLDEEAPMIASPGSGIIFDGKTMHRGLANKSNRKRIFAYVAVTSEMDANDENNDNALMEPEMV